MDAADEEGVAVTGILSRQVEYYESLSHGIEEESDKLCKPRYLSRTETSVILK